MLCVSIELLNGVSTVDSTCLCSVGGPDSLQFLSRAQTLTKMWLQDHQCCRHGTTNPLKEECPPVQTTPGQVSGRRNLDKGLEKTVQALSAKCRETAVGVGSGGWLFFHKVKAERSLSYRYPPFQAPVMFMTVLAMVFIYLFTYIYVHVCGWQKTTCRNLFSSSTLCSSSPSSDISSIVDRNQNLFLSHSGLRGHYISMYA